MRNRENGTKSMWRLANHFLNQEKDYFYTFKFQINFQTGKLQSMFTKMHYNQTFKTQEKIILKGIIEFFQRHGTVNKIDSWFLIKNHEVYKVTRRKCNVAKEHKSNNIILSVTILQKRRTNEGRIEMKKFVTLHLV